MLDHCSYSDAQLERERQIIAALNSWRAPKPDPIITVQITRYITWQGPASEAPKARAF